MHVVISNANESYIKIQCDESVAWELRDAFSFRPPGFQFVPSYRQKLWDGYLRLFNPLSRQIYRGLAPQVMEWLKKRGYTSTVLSHIQHASMTPNNTEITYG